MGRICTSPIGELTTSFQHINKREITYDRQVIKRNAHINKYAT